MINAVMFFNNNGQPRLTKFYTQLASRVFDTRDEFGLISSRTRRLSKPFCDRSSTSFLRGHRLPATSSPCHLSLLQLARLLRQTHLPRSPTGTMLRSTSSLSLPPPNPRSPC